MASFFGLLGLFIVPETSHARILQQRAKKIRFETQNWAIHSKADTVNLSPKAIVQTYLFRSFIMLAQEPILLLLTIYMSLVYGTLYLFFTAYPISFQGERGWNAGVGALPFLGIGVGVMFGSVTIV
jgi:DHA1 family multidrug resistance protein-like MFS transporter